MYLYIYIYIYIYNICVTSEGGLKSNVYVLTRYKVTEDLGQMSTYSYYEYMWYRAIPTDAD